MLNGDSDKFIDVVRVIDDVAITGNIPERFDEVTAVMGNEGAREVDQFLAQLGAEGSIAQVGSAHA